jgi:hypothetical protein
MPWLDCVSLLNLLSLEMISAWDSRAYGGKVRLASEAAPVETPRGLRRAARRESRKNFRAARRREKFLRGVRGGRESRYNPAR